MHSTTPEDIDTALEANPHRPLRHVVPRDQGGGHRPAGPFAPQVRHTLPFHAP